MANNPPDDRSTADSQQESEQGPADSDHASAQPDNQPAAGGESASQPGNQPTNEEAMPASEDQPASTEERTGQLGDQPAEPMDQAIRSKLELDLQSADVTPAKTKTGDCSSWENDPRRFAKIIADNYLSTEFDHMPGLIAPEGMSCWSSQPKGTVSDFCYLHYSDSWNVIVSLSNIPDYVKARAIAPERKPMCTYSYDCIDTGTLVFTKLGCYP